MRGAVTFGTASKSELNRLPGLFLAKTGRHSSDDYHTDGWFVGLAGDDAEAPSPRKCVWLSCLFERARDSMLRSGEISIFESYQLNERVPASIEVRINARGVDFQGKISVTPQTIRVRIGRTQ